MRPFVTLNTDGNNIYIHKLRGQIPDVASCCIYGVCPRCSRIMVFLNLTCRGLYISEWGTPW